MKINSLLVPKVGYSFQQSNARSNNYSDFLAEKLLRSYFASVYSSSSVSNSPSSNTTKILLSKFRFSAISSTSVEISFSYYVSSSSASRNRGSTPPMFMEMSSFNEENSSNNPKSSQILRVLTKLYQREVKIHCTRIHYPYLDSTILAQYLAHNSKTNTFLQFQEAILSYPSLYSSSLPASITGMKIQLSGRIITEAIIPRVTVKSSLVGSFTSSNLLQNSSPESFFIDYGYCTSKNEVGSFTIKVWIAQQQSSPSYLR